ncbi:MAG: hypothetical protein WBA25_03270 [Jannaschia sp.]
MIARTSLILATIALLSGCASQGGMQVPSGVRDIAVQRMRFAAEAVCLNNTGPRAQDRAARALDFPVRTRDGDATVYVNPGTLTFLRLGPAPEQAVTTPAGQRIVYDGSGCSVGSPVVDIRTANRVVGEILAPRLVDGSTTLASPVGAGTNRAGGVGLFFADLSVTLPEAETTITDPETGEARSFVHPVILIIHK